MSVTIIKKVVYCVGEKEFSSYSAASRYAERLLDPPTILTETDTRIPTLDFFRKLESIENSAKWLLKEILTKKEPVEITIRAISGNLYDIRRTDNSAWLASMSADELKLLK
jgi:hypothetical protein